jgi:hypothetical protein
MNNVVRNHTSCDRRLGDGRPRPARGNGRADGTPEAEQSARYNLGWPARRTADPAGRPGRAVLGSSCPRKQRAPDTGAHDLLLGVPLERPTADRNGRLLLTASPPC